MPFNNSKMVSQILHEINYVCSIWVFISVYIYIFVLFIARYLGIEFSYIKNLFNVWEYTYPDVCSEWWYLIYNVIEFQSLKYFLIFYWGVSTHFHVSISKSVIQNFAANGCGIEGWKLKPWYIVRNEVKYRRGPTFRIGFSLVQRI